MARGAHARRRTCIFGRARLRRWAWQVRTLEAHAAEIRREVLAAHAAPGGLGRLTSLEHDSESLVAAGEWGEVNFVKNGRPQRANIAALPHTAQARVRVRARRCRPPRSPPPPPAAAAAAAGATRPPWHCAAARSPQVVMRPLAAAGNHVAARGDVHGARRRQGERHAASRQRWRHASHRRASSRDRCRSWRQARRRAAAHTPTQPYTGPHSPAQALHSPCTARSCAAAAAMARATLLPTPRRLTLYNPRPRPRPRPRR